MLNTIALMGRLTRDPELRRTPSGVAVTSFTLAVDRDFKDADGTKKVDFIDCVAWKSNAENAARYLAKGRMVSVKGRLQLRDWTDKDGNKRRSAEVVVDSFYFADSRPDSGGTVQPAAGGVNVPGPDFRELDEDDGDLPF